MQVHTHTHAPIQQEKPHCCARLRDNVVLPIFMCVLIIFQNRLQIIMCIMALLLKHIICFCNCVVLFQRVQYVTFDAVFTANTDKPDSLFSWAVVFQAAGRVVQTRGPALSKLGQGTCASFCYLRKVDINFKYFFQQQYFIC